MGMKIVRTIAAIEGETVLIRWTAKDGTTCHREYTIPPRSTREKLAQDIREPPRETPSRV